jgi:polysaccharide export outer membrane protein
MDLALTMPASHCLQRTGCRIKPSRTAAGLCYTFRKVFTFLRVCRMLSHRGYRLIAVLVACMTSVAMPAAAQQNPASTVDHRQDSRTAVAPQASPTVVDRQGAEGSTPASVFNPGSAGVANPDSTATPNVPSGPSISPQEIAIGGGDLLNISVYGASDLTQEVRVSPMGDIYLPLIGHVQVGGLTAEQAQAIIEGRYRDGHFINDPHVTVFIKEYATQGVTVMGEVAHPGVYPLLGARRLFDLLAAAGSVTEKAANRATITHRNQPDQPVTVTISKDPAESARSNVEVLPGDTIVVPKAGMVYVVGEVGKPSGIIMDQNGSMTALQAIAIAGGTTPYASTNHSRLIRKIGTGREELPLPLNRILQAKAADVELQPEDIIFVPASAGKRAAKRSLDAIVNMSAALAIYRP